MSTLTPACLIALLATSLILCVYRNGVSPCLRRLGSGRSEEFVNKLTHGQGRRFVRVPALHVKYHLQAFVEDVIAAWTTVSRGDHSMREQVDQAMLFALGVQN